MSGGPARMPSGFELLMYAADSVNPDEVVRRLKKRVAELVKADQTMDNDEVRRWRKLLPRG